jgi:hypothetical protein
MKTPSRGIDETLYDFQQSMRPRKIVNQKANSLIAFLVFTFTLIIYWMTQNRSLAFWDVGEYITCSSILGVPHPPGNPFYILLGRFAVILGFDLPHALVVNSLSGIMAALAVMFTYLFTVKFVSMLNENKYLIHLAGIIAALYTAFSFTFWNNAVEASVYPGRDLIINFVIWLTLVWVEKTREYSHQNYLLLIIYAFFIGFSIHQTSLQILPAVLFIVIYPLLLQTIKTSKFWIRFVLFFILGLILYFSFIQVSKELQIPDMAKIVTAFFFCLLAYFYLRDRIPLKVWLWGLAFMFIALTPHLYLFVRSELRPFINEGHPHNLELFSDYVLRRQYGVSSFIERRATLFYQINHHFIRYLFWQFFHAETIGRWLSISPQVIANLGKVIVVFLGLGGIYYQIKKNKHSFIYLFSFFLMSSLAMIFVMNLSDGEVRERDYFFVSGYYLWAVWMSIGSVWLISHLKEQRKRILPLVAVILISLPIINFASQYFIHDRSKEFVALDYGLNFLNSLEENAIIFTHGDNDTFPLWYAQAVADPYSFENSYPAKDVYPDEKTEAAIAAALEYKRTQLKGIRPDVSVANLSLLNTPWYIKQLRDLEGIHFSLPDEQIDNLRPMRVERTRAIGFNSPNPADNFSVILEGNRVMFIKDFSAIQIVRDNYGRRPIYFAVTIADEIVFQNNLRNEGMVNRLVPTRSTDQIYLERLKMNIEEIYSYRSIFEDEVYKDDNHRKLITNYGAAFMRVSSYYHQQGNLSRAAHYMEKAIRFIQNNERFLPGLAQLYLDAGDLEEALITIEKIMTLTPRDLNLYIQAAYIHLERDSIDAAFDVFNRAIDNKIYSSELISYIYLASVDYQLYDRGIEILEKLRKEDPHDIIPEYIETLQTMKDSANFSD